MTLSHTLYGLPLSQPWRAVMWPCLIKRLPINVKLAVPGGVPKVGTTSPEFLEKFPIGTIPALETSCGKHISESSAILGYLADKHGWDDLYPVDLLERAKVNEYMHWHHNGTRNLTRAFFVRYVRPEKTPSDIESFEKQAIHALRTIETAFLGREGGGEGRFLIKSQAGPTIADFLCYSEVVQVAPDFGNTFEGLSEFPLLTQWMQDMKSLPYHDETYASLKALGDLKNPNDKEGNPLPSISDRLGPATKVGLKAIHSVLPTE